MHSAHSNLFIYLLGEGSAGEGGGGFLNHSHRPPLVSVACEEVEYRMSSAVTSCFREHGLTLESLSSTAIYSYQLGGWQWLPGPLT